MKINSSLLSLSLVLLALTGSTTEVTLNVEVFQPGKLGHYVNSGIITSKSEMLIIDTQLSPLFGTRLAQRAKQLNKKLKVIYITHGHADHNWGTAAILKIFPGTPVYATQETIDKIKAESPSWLNPGLFRPFLDNVGAPTEIVIPQHPDLQGTTFRPWNARSKRDVTFVPSNGTFWGSNLIISGIHFLMDEVESLARRESWITNAKNARIYVKTNKRSVVPGHLDDGLKWTQDEMLDFPIEYVERFNEALKENTTDKFWNRVMDKYADTSLLFLLDWSSGKFYESKRKTPVP
ncbi:Hydroxyacylglutathione hydrolase [Mortierella sp. AD031]|nr:Hydroxyacylglutathione hydrolase [Mortierella sp. AD031]